MTKKKRYYRTNVNLEDNNHEPYYNIRDRKKGGNNVLFMVGGKYTSKEIVDRLNEQDEQIKKLEKENKFLRCTIESNSQDDYIDYLEKQSKRLEAIITKLEKKEQEKEKDNVMWALNQFKYKEKTETEQEAFLILEKAFKKKLL